MTDRLSAPDAAFLYSEDTGTPMHVGGVVLLRPPRADFDYVDIMELINSRLSLVPRYRQKVRFVPLRLARPVWVDDDNFDLTYHVRRSALPRPGSREQLDELVSRLISRPLDRSKPLWEMYIVEGLADGTIAVVNKTHHAMVDRIGAVDVAAAILDTSRRARSLPESPWIPTPPPGDVDLVVDAIADLVARPSEVIEVIKLTALDLQSTASALTDAAGTLVEIARRTIHPAPRSVLNSSTGGQRRFCSLHADLADIKAIRRAHGGTVNDVILTVIAGALRTWLLSRGEPVTATTTLQAMVPLSVQGPDGTPTVSSGLVELPVAEPNPVMRLHQMSYAMSALTEGGTTVGADALLELGRFAPPTLHALGARVASQLSRRMYNVLITNAPGPQTPLYAAGAKVEAMYPVAPLTRGHALSVACTSYNGGVFFGLTADREAMPDVQEFGTLLQEAVDELRSVGKRPQPATPRAAGGARAHSGRPAPHRAPRASTGRTGAGGPAAGGAETGPGAGAAPLPAPADDPRHDE